MFVEIYVIYAEKNYLERNGNLFQSYGKVVNMTKFVGISLLKYILGVKFQVYWGFILNKIKNYQTRRVQK